MISRKHSTGLVVAMSIMILYAGILRSWRPPKLLRLNFPAHCSYRVTQKLVVNWPDEMPRDGAIIFSDLIGKLDVLRVSCEKCGRDGCYGLSRLIN